ncbi:MAG: ABC transporter ATP-binding protein, partial [Gammaproteobacteria bacterium]|nr:ABC transporter ATP-binding protein [Gammaproteobacteria bacterium]
MSPERASRTFKVTEIIPQFFRRIGKTRRLIPLQITLLCLDGAIHSTVPAITGYIIDQLNTDPAAFVSEKLIWLAPAVVGLSLLYYSCVASQHYLANRIYRSAGMRFQVELYRHLQTLSADFYQRNHIGEITSRLTNDINAGVMPLYPQLTMIIWCLSLLIPAAISMFFISRPLFCIFMATSVIFIILTRIIIPYIRRLNRQMQDEAGRINARITENVSANSLIRAFAQEANFTDQVNRHTQVYLTKALRTARVSIFFADIMTMFLTVLSPLGILLAGAYFIRQGVSIGALVAASLYWRLATVPINSLLNQ